MKKLTNSTTGFTIIEMLVVITITVILMGLIFGPVISSFNLTHQAQVMTEAQDTARQTLEQIQRELSQAMFVYGNSNTSVIFPIPDPSSPTSAIPVPVKYAKIDFVLPKLMMHCSDPNHPPSSPRDYERGDKAWPSCPADSSDNVEARPIQPLRQDPKIVRYFIGLKDNDPSVPYANIYTMDDVPATAKENPFVLYRAEFGINDPEDPGEIDSRDLFPDSMPIGDRLNWDEFFYADQAGANGNPIWRNWKRIAQVVGPSEDVDMVTVKWVSGQPQVTPAIKFMPTGVDNDTLVATYMSDKSAEAPTSCPTTFRATHGHWAPNFKVMVYTSDYSSWYYTDFDPGTRHFWIYDKNGMQVFDITQYRQDQSFVGSLDMMFDVDPNRGEVTFAFPASWVLNADEIENAFREKYQESLNETGIGIGERLAQVRGAVDPDGGTGSVPNAKIIPGSEQVVGPDMTPGPSFGTRLVRYERVPLVLGDAGLNQYRIDYETGQIWFTADPNTALPSGDVEVSYYFHNNGPDQIVKADYDTKNLMTIALAIRLYDSISGKPIVVELSDQVQVRNVAR